MILFFDTSALVNFFHQEKGTDVVVQNVHSFSKTREVILSTTIYVQNLRRHNPGSTFYPTFAYSKLKSLEI